LFNYYNVYFLLKSLQIINTSRDCVIYLMTVGLIWYLNLKFISKTDIYEQVFNDKEENTITNQ